MCALVLHNFLRKSKSSRNIYCPPGLIDQENENGEFIPGTWRSAMEDTLFTSLTANGNNPTCTAKRIRDDFKDFFMNEGSVESQWERC